MFNIKVIIDNKNKTHYIHYINSKQIKDKKINYPGEDLIEFLLMDLTEYKNKLSRYFINNKIIIEDIENNYDNLHNIIYHIAELIKNKHDIAYSYLVSKIEFVFLSEKNILNQLHLAFRALEEIIRLQEIFKEGAEICLNAESLTKLTQSERFILFLDKHPQYENFSFKTPHSLTLVKNGESDLYKINDINNNNTNYKTKHPPLAYKQFEEVNPIKYLILEELEEFLFYEFAEMCKLELKIKKCQLCGEFFILKSKHNAYYCNRIYENNLTCNQIGIKKTYKLKISNNPTLKEYERIYNAKYAKMKRDELKESSIGESKEEFMKWSKIAQKLRKQYINNEITKEDFLLRLSL
ncbi:TPA: hypothetical protein UL242_002506 [Clostridioides difficile]|nr:hypothetical protein [Clostridioides difficile]MBY1662188.1 DUF6076 domain-containing protein [Clostridioides difficile]PBF99876.1 hypothetical protein BGV00_06580 [Clostridioides difficile]HBF8040690.1 hypothetical protein [Clostridioides difficile]HBF9450509.1 hypothetical protein [Clostridioides difficile]